jgi:hypothetical protein
MKSILSLIFLTSCSLFGIQDEEGPKYEVLVSDGDFEIRRYAPYIIAKTTVSGSYEESSGKAFRILAGYIFGKNEGEKKIAMTSPVEVNNKPMKIAMTSPVEMSEDKDSFTMAFSMPSKFSLEELPKPIDKRISFEQVPIKVVAAHRYSWLSSKKKNDKKAKELREWLKNYPQYKPLLDYSYAGFNPPWTIPFLRRNEVHIQLLE